MRYILITLLVFGLPIYAFTQSSPIFSLYEENNNFGQTPLERDIHNITDAYFERVYREGGFYEDPKLEDYLDSLVQILHPADLPDDLKPVISIVRDPDFVMESFADGRAILSTGLLANCEYEDEIAFALAYIFAEHILRHPLRKKRFWNERIVSMRADASNQRITNRLEEVNDYEHNLIWQADSLARAILESRDFELIGGAQLLEKFPQQIREEPPSFLLSLFGTKILGFRRPFKEERAKDLLEQDAIVVVMSRKAIGGRLDELRQDLLRQLSFRPTYQSLLQLDSLESRLASASFCTQEQYDLTRAEAWYYLLKQENHLAVYLSCQTNPDSTYRQAYGPRKWDAALAHFTIELDEYMLGLVDQVLNCSNLEARKMRILGLYQERLGNTSSAVDLARTALAVPESDNFPILDRRALQQLVETSSNDFDNQLGILPLVVDFRIISDVDRGSKHYYYRGDYLSLESSHKDEDVVYDLSFSPVIQEAFMKEFPAQELMEGVPFLSYDEMSPEEGRLFWEAYELTFRNILPWLSPRKNIFGDMGPAHEMILQPELFNNLADRLNARYLALITVNGTHYQKQSEEGEGELPEIPVGTLHLAAWVVDGTTGELVYATHGYGYRITFKGRLNSTTRTMRAYHGADWTRIKQMTDRRLGSWSRMAVDGLVRRLKRKDFVGQ